MSDIKDIIKKFKKREAEYQGPYALVLHFTKQTDFFQIPVRVIKNRLKEEPYSVSAMVYDQLFQASQVLRRQLHRSLPSCDCSNAEVRVSMSFNG